MPVAPVLLTALIAAVLSATAEAQPAPQIQFGPSTPTVEFGAHINLLDLFGDGSRTYGGRFAKRHTDWLVSEVSYDRTSWTYENRDSRLLIANVRVQSPVAHRNQRPFISLGVARAGGMSFKWSPMVAGGSQLEVADGILALRMEFQFFLSGRADVLGGGPYRRREEQPYAGYRSPYERARLVLGLAVGIP